MAIVCSKNRCVAIPDSAPVSNDAAMGEFGNMPGFQPLPAGYPVRSGQARPAGLINGRPVYSTGQPGSPTGGNSLEQAMDINRRGDIQNAAHYLRNNQELTPAMKPIETEARNLIAEQDRQNPGLLSRLFSGSTPTQEQPQTLAQKVQGFDNSMSNASFDPIEKYYKDRFYSETVPALANRFVGSKSGSDFAGSLGSAGAQLNTNLAALRSEYDSALRDQMIRMAAINRSNMGQQGPSGQSTPSWQQLAANVVAPIVSEAAGLIPGIGPLARAGVGGVANYFKNNASAAPNQQSYLGNSYAPTQPQAQLLNSRIGSGFQTPEDVQRFQAVTGLGGSAAMDFSNTFRQPGSQAQMLDQNINKFSKFMSSSPGSALGVLGLRS